MAFDLPAGKTAKSVQVTVNGNAAKAGHSMTEKRVVIELAEAATIKAGEKIEIEIQL